MRAPVLALACLLLLSGPVTAEDEPKQAPAKALTAEQAADAVLAAFQAEDDGALVALVRNRNPDSWRVADELCYRGQHDAAEAFAKAAPRPDVEKLPAYVAAWRTRQPDHAERKLLVAVNAAMQAGSPQRIVEETASLQGAFNTVSRIRLARARGFALRMVPRLRDSASVLRRAAGGARALGWVRHAAELYHEAGLSAYQGSAWPDTLASWHERLAVEEQRRNRTGMAAALTNIGAVQARLGEYAKALVKFQRALEQQEALADEVGVAVTLRNIGLVHQALGSYGKALPLLERALSAYQALGSTAGVASALGSIGLVHHRLGNYAKALSFMNRALAAQEAIGAKGSHAGTLANIGNVHLAQGNYDEALSFFVRALAAQQAMGDRAGAAASLGNIGSVHYSIGNLAEALSEYKRALAAKEALGDKVGAADTLGNIGNVHLGMGSYEKALSTYQRALAAKEALGEQGWRGHDARQHRGGPRVARGLCESAPVPRTRTLGEGGARG